MPNAATPATLPARLSVYPRSGSAPDISLPMRCASVTNSAATMTNSNGNSIVLSTTTTSSAVPLVK